VLFYIGFVYIDVDKGSVRLVYVSLIDWVRPFFASQNNIHKEVHVSLTSST
jgi:hypothetical protein